MGANSSRSRRDEIPAAEVRRLECCLPPEVLAQCRSTYTTALQRAGGTEQLFRLDFGLEVSRQLVAVAFPSHEPTLSPSLQWVDLLRGVVEWRALSEGAWAVKLCQVVDADTGEGQISRQSLRSLALGLSREASGVKRCALSEEEAKAFDAACDPATLAAPLSSAAPPSRFTGVDEAATWVATSLPGMGLCLWDFLLWCAYGRPELSTGQSSETPEQREEILTEGLAWALAMLLGRAGPELRRWQCASLLYRQSSHGSSTNIFLTKVEGYPGPVVLLFELGPPEEGGASGERGRLVVGAVVDATLFSPLGLSADGAPSTSLLALHPRMCRFAVKVDLVEAKRRRQEVAYFTGHSRRAASSRVSSSKAATGLMGFGGTSTTPRMELDAAGASMTLRRAVKGDMFHSGPLVRLPEFDSYAPIRCPVLEWEVWGLGGEAALAAQQEARAREDRFVEQRKHVDRAQFAEDWENSPDRAILGFAAGGVTGREVARFSKAEEATLDRNRVEKM